VVRAAPAQRQAFRAVHAFLDQLADHADKRRMRSRRPRAHKVDA
jgi:hypothetical protein